MPPNKSPHLVFQGDKFHRLTVLSYSHTDNRWRKHYLVECECGNRKTVQGTLLKSGNTKSCGCLAIESQRKWAKANRLPDNGGVINQILLQYKRHAKDRNIEFFLSAEEFAVAIRKPCHYCGVVGGNTIVTRHCRGGFKYNGVDRVNSLLPYTTSNIVPCCGTCNIAKGSLSATEFIAMAIRIADKQRLLQPHNERISYPD